MKLTKEQAQEYINRIESLEVVDDYEEEDIKYLTPNHEDFSVKELAYFEFDAPELYKESSQYDFIVETDEYFYLFETFKNANDLFGSRILKSAAESNKELAYKLPARIDLDLTTNG